MQTPDRILLPFRLDPKQLKQDLKQLEQSEWINHFVTQNYDGEWSVLPLRGPKGANHPVTMIYSDPSCKEFEDTPFIQHTPYIHSSLQQFNCPITAVRLMKLSPGSVIKEHSDHDLEIEQGAARLHIPIETNPHIEFRLNGTMVHMQEGECWYLKLSEPHSVKNLGDTDRIHLVVDILVNQWFLSEVEQALKGSL